MSLSGPRVIRAFWDVWERKNGANRKTGSPVYIGDLTAELHATTDDIRPIMRDLQERRLVRSSAGGWKPW
jgi:hypothetical protein